MSPQRSGPIAIIGFRVHYFDPICSEIFDIEHVDYESLNARQIKMHQKFLKRAILDRTFDGDYDRCTSVLYPDVDIRFVAAFPDPTMDETFFVGVEVGEDNEISLSTVASIQDLLVATTIPLIEQLLQEQEYKIHLADKRDLLYNDN